MNATRDKNNRGKITDSEISSNLPFQKLLYFNVFYSILFFYILLASYIFRVRSCRLDSRPSILARPSSVCSCSRPHSHFFH